MWTWVPYEADDIRREGTVLDRQRFDAVAAALAERYGWDRTDG